VFHRRKKVIQDWIDMRVSKWWQNFNFGVKYPRDSILSSTNVQLHKGMLGLNLWLIFTVCKYLYVSKSTVIKNWKGEKGNPCVCICPLFDISDSRFDISSTKYLCFCCTVVFVRLLPSSMRSVIWITGGETPFSPNTLDLHYSTLLK